MRRAVFFDRDGVLNRAVNYPEWGVDSPAHPEDLRLYPDAARAVRTVRAWGFLAVLVSNQPGIAKGKYSEQAFQEIDRRLDDLLKAEDAQLDGRFYCLHHPQAVQVEYRQACDCRKPRPGLLLRAAAQFGLDLSGSYLVGDTSSDVGAAESAGCLPLLVLRADSTSTRLKGADDGCTVRDLDEALTYIGRREGIHGA